MVKMRIAIDARSILRKEKAGIGYYTINLINSLAEIDKENEYILYSRIKLLSLGKKLPVLPGRNFSNKLDRFGLGPSKVLKRADIFHTSAFDLMPPKGARFVITVHDIIPRLFPQWHSRDAARRLRRGLKMALTAADAVLADTECALRDLVKYYPNEVKGKARVVYPGVGEEFGVLPKESKHLYNSVFLKYNIQSNYIIYIGTLEPRKNVVGLINAYNTLKRDYGIKQKLVIVGMKGWMYDDIFKLTLGLGLSEDIIFTGYVPREELKAFYNFADLSVYPSFYEGAGLPVLEAFKCGCPVVTSNVSSMPEFAGDAAVLVDPNDVDSIAKGIYSVLSDKEFRDNLISKSVKRAALFSWERTARQALEIFHEI